MARRSKQTFDDKRKKTLFWLFFLVIALFVGLLVRIYYIDENDGERYTKKVLSQQSYVSNAIAFKRGEIVDRNGTVLAKSQRVYNLVISPKDLLENEEHLDEVIGLLEQHFGVTGEEIRSVLAEKPESQYCVMKKYIESDVKKIYEEALKDHEGIRGVWFEEEYKREYPLNSVGCRVIGFANPGNTADIGIEGYYNDVLNGTNGRSYGYYDQNQELQEIVKPAKNGNTVVSTIDANIQQIVEEEVDKFYQQMGAKNVGVILMNPQNGEVLAMACNQQFDLNNPRELTKFYSDMAKADPEMDEEDALNEMWHNYCISDAYEPGSTFKPMTVGAALEEATESNNSTFLCNGGEEVGGQFIKCTSHHGVITLSQAVEKSCNDALMQIGARLGRKKFAKYEGIFCFGKRLGIDLPGEAAGIVFSEEQLNSQELATSSFGQGVTTTMVQIAGATCSLINGGKYYQPHVVKEIRNEGGAIVQTVEPVLLRQTVSARTSELVKRYMYNTVEYGTGEKCRIQGYAIGGKTGTAEKVPRGTGKHLVSFIGFVPADSDPELLVYIIVDEPNAEEQDHSYYATDMVCSIMKKVMPFLDIFPSTEVQKDEGTQTDAAQEDTGTAQTDAADGTVDSTNTRDTGQEQDAADLTEPGTGQNLGIDGESVEADPFDPENLGREGGFFEPEESTEAEDSLEGQNEDTTEQTDYLQDDSYVGIEN